jgi:hypothetical protein
VPAQGADAIGPWLLLQRICSQHRASSVMLHFRVSPVFAGHLQAKPPPACVAANPRFAAFAADLQQNSASPWHRSLG